jgi:NTP pyrophosphatase (non-canonical NTP hydrolase)
LFYMTFDEYQKNAITTDLMDGKMKSANDPAFVAKLLGLVGESGEVAEKFKKIIRDKGGVVSDTDKLEVSKELGDVLWYISSIAHYLGIPLEEIADGNLKKLSSRHARGTARGSGDNR